MSGSSGADNSDSALRVSAVIPAYNRESTIARAIESVLAQSAPPHEVIIVDDGSEDATLERIRAFGDRVRPIAQENAGAAAARNRGVREASSEWIAFLDSDDFWNPEHLERTRAAIDATDGRAGVYFSDLRRPESESGGFQWELSGYACDGDNELRDDGREWAMSKRQPLMLQSSVYCRATYLEVGGIWEELRAREDTHLFFKLLIGRPACAVRYCATEMTSDGVTGERLSEKYQASGKHLEQTVTLYRDVLRQCALNGAERQEISSRLAAAHLGLGKRALSDRRLCRSAAQLTSAFLANPGRFFAAVTRRLGSPDSTPSDPTRVDPAPPKTKVSR